MEPSALVSVAEGGNVTLDDLPYDVHRKLFSYLPTEELISVWRLVSKRWSRFASEMCRQRRVSLRMPRHHEIFTSPIGHLFSDLDNLPFSTAILELDSTMHERFAFSDYVTERFGEHFKAAQISTRLNYYAAFFETLRSMPNLVALEFLPQAEEVEIPSVEYTFTYQRNTLPPIKSLKMVYEEDGRFMTILEIFFRDPAPNLESIDFQLNTGGIRDADFNRCAELLSSRNFPKTSLDLPFKSEYTVGWRTLVDRGPFDIQTVEVSSWDTERLDMTSDLLVPFLGNCLGLTSLTLHGFEQRSLTSKRVRLPAMPTLRKLELCETFGGIGDHGSDEAMSVLQFERFEARRLPSLTKVVMNCSAYYNDREHPIDLRQFFDVNEQGFLGVTSLDVGSTPSKTNWADVFPCVTTLYASLWNAKQFTAIFTNMSQVTVLDLQLFEGIFFGLLEHIGSLKKLMTLILGIAELGNEIGTFVSLSPLHLKIGYFEYKLSDFCLELLRNRHLSVELYKHKNC